MLPNLLLASLALAGFDSDYLRATTTMDGLDPAYLAELEDYFASPVLDDERCGSAAPGNPSARLLLSFDAAGTFRVTGEASNAAMLRCLRNTFAANPPPIPPRLPLALPYAFERH